MNIEELTQQNITNEVDIFSSLADPTRLKLFKILCRQHSPSSLCVNALAHLLGVSQPAISQHLKVLKNIRLVKGERHGYHIHYSVHREALEQYRKLIMETLLIDKSDDEEACEKSCSIRRKEHE